MKRSSLALVVAVPLIVTPASPGGFQGIEITSARYPGPYIVFSIYAVFDRPGEDYMVHIAGVPNFPLRISILDGSFFQHPLGTDKAPSCTAISANPPLAYDTFVTVGVRAVGSCGQPMDATTLTPTWPGVGTGPLVLTNDAWAVTLFDTQADPFNTDYEYGDGRVLLGQFTTTDGTAIHTDLLTGQQSNGVSTEVYSHVDHYHCSEIDTDGDGQVSATDLLDVISDWGCLGLDCPGDVSGDGVVGVRDFLDVMVFWGPCPG